MPDAARMLERGDIFFFFFFFFYGRASRRTPRQAWTMCSVSLSCCARIEAALVLESG
jgi:hypothetical protein